MKFRFTAVMVFEADTMMDAKGKLAGEFAELQDPGNYG